MWTVRTLRKHLLALRAADQLAIQKLEVSTDKRFDNVNEFRGALSDLGKDMMLRKEAEAQFAALTSQVAALSTRLDKREGADTGKLDSRALLFSAVSVIIAIIAALVAYLKS